MLKLSFSLQQLITLVNDFNYSQGNASGIVKTPMGYTGVNTEQKSQCLLQKAALMHPVYNSTGGETGAGKA